MSGTTANPPNNNVSAQLPSAGAGTTVPVQASQEKYPIDSKEAVFGHHVLSILNHDVVMAGDPRNLEAVFDAHGVKNDQGELDLDKTAEKLVKSLDALIPDDAARDGENKLVVSTKRGLDSAAAATLTAFIKDSGAKTAKELGDVFSKARFPDPDNPRKKESMRDFLYRAGQQADGSSFDMQSNAAIIGALRELLNKFHPGLGDMFMGFVQSAGIVEDTSGLTESKEALAEGHFVMWSGGGTSMAKFWGHPDRDDQGNAIDYNSFRGPRSSSQVAAFFDGTFHNGEAHTLGGGTSRVFASQSFDDMILKRWEEQGVVQFKDPNDLDARQRFIDYARQATLGGQVGPELTERLVKNGVITFSSDTEKAAFTQHVQKFDMGGMSSVDAANNIVRYAKMHDGVDFPGAPQGAHSTVFDRVRDEMIGSFDHYERAKNSDHFAAKMVRYAEHTPEVRVHMNNDVEAPMAPTLVRPVGGGSASSSASEEPAQQRSPNTTTTHRASPSGHGGQATIGPNGQTLIGGQPAPQAFGHSASGANVVSEPEVVVAGSVQEPERPVLDDPANTHS